MVETLLWHCICSPSCSSPQAPTPRRSLFTQDLFRPREHAGEFSSRMNPSCTFHIETDNRQVQTPPVELDTAGTPPIMSSSPYHGDAMDISPLPHKVPRFVAQVTLPSPTPETTPDDGDDSHESTPDLLTPEDVFEPTAQANQSTQPPNCLALPE